MNQQLENIPAVLPPAPTRKKRNLPLEWVSDKSEIRAEITESAEITEDEADAG